MKKRLKTMGDLRYIETGSVFCPMDVLILISWDLKRTDPKARVIITFLTGRCLDISVFQKKKILSL